MRTVASVALIGLVGVLACASGGLPASPPIISTSPEPAPAATVPGFDTRDYPGDATMEKWRAESPYRWVGYYLPAPCYTRQGWAGKRESLRGMGWGLALLFVGEQDWGAMGGTRDTTSVATEGARCTRANLTAAQGTANAQAATAAAASDRFAAGTIIYLDVERVERVSAELSAYVRAWFAGVLDGAQYVPALYAHERNAPELYAIASEEFAKRQRADRPMLWLAKSGSGFDLAKSPTDSGIAETSIWQGLIDARETYGGVTLRIDANVAARTAIGN